MIERLQRLMKELGQDYPGLHKEVQDMLSLKPELGWADEVFLPFGGWWSIYSNHFGEPGLEDMSKVGRLATLGTWKYSQGIYIFEPELWESLITMELPDKVPMNVFTRLPEWSLYIVTPESRWLGEKLYGLWVYLDSANNENIPGSKMSDIELRVIGDTESESYPVHAFMLDNSLTIKESFSQGSKKGFIEKGLTLVQTEEVLSGVGEAVKPYLSLLLYICSEEPEIEGREPDSFPAHNYPQRVKGGERLFVPDKMRTWNLGKEISRYLSEPQDYQGGHKRRHVRRGHWHTYRVGKGRRDFIIKWLPPNVVGGHED